MAEAEKDPQPATGTVTQIGSYKLLAPLGSGGMSSVYRARHVDTGHIVALKVLPRSLAKNATLLQRFLREANSAESLEHPNIVSIFDRGSEDGRYYLVLEYMPGGDVHERVRTKGPLPIDEAVKIIHGAAEGLDHALGRGMIHRDIKPANLLLSGDGRVKIADLGLALQIEQEDERVTRDGTTVGTVDYMAPEQARDSRATSVRSDVYSLGCTFYYLLTGAAPFAGGDVAEKLKKHATEAPPDPRVLRPEVPEGLARLIQKMMAKKPEARYGDYHSLLTALDAVTSAAHASTAAAAPPTQFALLADDDEDEDSDDAIELTIADAPAPSSPPRVVKAGPSAKSSIVDTRGASARSSIVGRDGASPKSAPAQKSTAAPKPARDEAGPSSLAELAALEDEPAARPIRRKSPGPAAAAPTLGVDDAYGMIGGAPATVRRVEERPLKDYIIKGLMAGVGIVLAGVLLYQGIAALTGTPAEEPTEGEPVEPVASTDSGGEVETPVLPVRPLPKKSAPGKAVEAPVVAAAWSEPQDTERTKATEPRYSGGAEAKLTPSWVERIGAALPDGPKTVVRRLVSGKAAGEKSGLATAMDTPGGVIELADDGPFYEHDLRVGSRARVVRAAPGMRPIVVLDPPTTAAAKEEGGVIVVDAPLVLFEGIDFVVRSGPGELPLQQTAVFLVRSGTLVLQGCSVSQASATGPTMDLVRLEERAGIGLDEVPRVLVERSLGRGHALRGVHLAAGRGEAVIRRSLLICGDAPAVEVSGRGTVRRAAVVRSVAGSRKAMLELGSPAGSPAFALSTFASQLARIDGGTGRGLISVRDDDQGELRGRLTWSGDHVALSGWPEVTSTIVGRRSLVADLEAARSIWPDLGEDVRESGAAWSQSVAQAWGMPESLAPMAGPFAWVLGLVERPMPFLWERTVGAFAPMAIPTAATTSAAPGTTPPPGTPVRRGVVGMDPIHYDDPVKIRQGQAAGKAAASKEGFADGVLEATFDPADPQYRGDLGAYLAKVLKPEVRLARVHVVGSGQGLTMMPVRLEGGIVVEIDVRNPNGPLPSWRAPVGAGADALIDAKDADLVLRDVHLEQPPDGGPKHLVRVTDGRLLMERCTLIVPGKNARAGAAIVFATEGTRPLAVRELPLPKGAKPGTVPSVVPGTESPLPTARVIDGVVIGGERALECELGHGSVVLSNSALAARGDAIVLRPRKVGRSRLAADLVMTRCTVAAGRGCVSAEAWPGAAPAPDRPWLVSTTACAFLDAFVHAPGSPRMAALRAFPGSVERGMLAWQSTGDAYDVGGFASAADRNEAAGADMARGWVDFWGRTHVKTPRGPRRAGVGEPAVRLLAGRLDPAADLGPASLAIDRAHAKTAKTVGIGADLARFAPAAPASTSAVKGVRDR